MTKRIAHSRQVALWFGTPLKTQGWSWLPWAQLVTWPIMAWVAGRTDPRRDISKNFCIGLLTTLIVHISEWAHNLAHAATASLIGKPADEIWIVGGMSRLNYHQLNDTSVSPPQHILRALGGPALNALLLIPALIWKKLARQHSLGAELADVAVKTNLFLSTISLLPIPGIDGGPILKWSLVWRGKSPEQADLSIQQLNLALSPLFACIGLRQFHRRQHFWGILWTIFSFSSLSLGMGWLREEQVKLPGQGGIDLHG